MPLKRRAATAAPSALQAVLADVLSFLRYDEQTRLHVCSKAFRQAAHVSRALTPATHVLYLFDGFVARADVRSAESLLRPFVGRSLFEYSHAPYVSKYLLLIRKDVLPEGHMSDLFRKVQNVFRRKALRELARFRRLRPHDQTADGATVTDASGAADARPGVNGQRAAEARSSANGHRAADARPGANGHRAAPVPTAGVAHSVSAETVQTQEAAAVHTAGRNESAAPASVDMRVLVHYAESAARVAARVDCAAAVAVRASFSATRVGVEGTCISAFLYMCTGHDAVATRLVKHALRCDPASFLAQWVLGNLLRKTDRVAACAALHRSAQLAPDFACAYFSLGVLMCTSSPSNAAGGLLHAAGGPSNAAGGLLHAAGGHNTADKATRASAEARAVVDSAIDGLFASCLALDPCHYLAFKWLGYARTRALDLRRVLRGCRAHPTDVHAARCAYHMLRTQAALGDAEYAQQCMALAHRVLVTAVTANPTGMRGTAWADLAHLYFTARRDLASALSCLDTYAKYCANDHARCERVKHTIQSLTDTYSAHRRRLRAAPPGLRVQGR